MQSITSIFSSILLNIQSQLYLVVKTFTVLYVDILSASTLHMPDGGF
jgi:hypothetical protein